MANNKKDIDQIESSIDFASVSERLESMAQSGELGRRKTVADLLDRVQPALLKARANKVPFMALAAFLKENGIPVSEPTLRQYMKGLSGEKKTRKTPGKKRERAAAPFKAEAAATNESPKHNESQKRPPRLAR